MIQTKIDGIIDIVRTSEGKLITFKEIAERFGSDVLEIEQIARIFEKNFVFETVYPLNPFEHPGIDAVKELPKVIEPEIPEGNVIEKYEINAENGHISGNVFILEVPGERGKIYFLKKQKVSNYTKIYLNYLQDKVALELPPETMQMTDEEQKKGVYKRQCELTEKYLSKIEKDPINIRLMCGMIRSVMFGLGEMDSLLCDDWLEEIGVNRAKTPILVYHRKYGWLKTNLFMENNDQILNYSAQIARRVGKQISTLNPILDAHLVTGDRVNATMPPISHTGNTLTIRRFARNPWTLGHMISKKMGNINPEMAALLWQAIHYEMSILVAGGTASGKTSILNALAMFIPPYQRIVSIEDTREIMLPSMHWNWIPMVTRLPNPEGLGGVNMLDLMINALRMRPDRIIVGEIRKSDEARVLFEAMQTGHSVYSTLHADTGLQVVRRLIEPPIEVPPSELEAVDLVLVQYRDRRSNLRRTSEISEIISSAGVPDISKSYLWRARNDTFELIKPPNKYVQSINLHTGMTEKEIYEDQKRKATILVWLDKHDFINLEQIGNAIKFYYSDEASLYKAAEQDVGPESVF
ncbi:MAG: type II/IV secretion system ATPase subunit [Candidatus Micrarchaeota archaeon]